MTRVVSEVDAALRELKLEEEKAKLELKEIREEVGNVRELVPKVGSELVRGQNTQL